MTVQEDGDEMKITAVSSEVLVRLLPMVASEDVLQVVLLVDLVGLRSIFQSCPF